MLSHLLQEMPVESMGEKNFYFSWWGLLSLASATSLESSVTAAPWGILFVLLPKVVQKIGVRLEVLAVFALALRLLVFA